MSRAGIEPFFFGASEKQLFGCHHAPQTRSTRDCGVLLCYPTGQEYIRSHRSYMQLASRLSTIGFHVLRFDFYGCGDSAGDFEQGQVLRWLTDISTAIGEIRARGHLSKVCLVGLRLGGTLAMMAAAGRGDVDSLVLWDPVVNGRAYVEELSALHREMLRYSYVEPRRDLEGDNQTEILGFPFTDSMMKDIEGIDLLEIRQKPANRILLMESHSGTNAGGLRDHLEEIHGRLEYRCIPSPRIWLEEPYTGLVPHRLLQSSISWISEVYP